MSTATGHQRIFISYRRDEAAGHAGRIYDAMVSRFGEDNVFMDVELAPGVDFVDYITDVVSSCTVLIAVMGRSWAEAPGPDGRPRLQDEGDFVRLEVGTAVQNPDVTVIPALVDKARMPKAEQLPDEMRALTRRNALELSDGRWRYDVGRLNDTLEQLLAGLTGFPVQVQPEPPAPVPDPPAREPAAPPSAPAASNGRLLVEAVAIAAAAAFLAAAVVFLLPKTHTRLFHDRVDPIGRQVVIWAVVGAALALWLGVRRRRTDLARLGLLGLLAGALAGFAGTLLWSTQVSSMSLEHWESTQIEQSGRWAVVNFAVTGAILGALLGALWRRRHLAAGLGGGLLGGILIQVVSNGANLNTEDMPGVAFLFAARGGAITAGAVLAILLLEQRRATGPPDGVSRSSSAAREPAAR